MARIKTDSRSLVNRQSVSDPVSNDEMEKMGDRVRMLRMVAKDGAELSRQALAKAVGMPVTTLQTLEDKSQEKSAYAARLAVYFGVHALWLECRKGPKYLSEVGHPSRAMRLDPDMLASAERYVGALEYLEQAKYSLNERAALLAHAYEMCMLDGGTLTAEHQAAFFTYAKSGGEHGPEKQADQGRSTKK